MGLRSSNCDDPASSQRGWDQCCNFRYVYTTQPLTLITDAQDLDYIHWEYRQRNRRNIDDELEMGDSGDNST
jgi:hypothetical protein